ncbi:hypothetical protein OEZ86_006388 [Tetradesmus obliquus]|nr:hypothetical protein OEZ86_006388 [Tetradesmus obliquus]
MEILRAAARHKGSLAVKHTTGGSCSFGKLLDSSASIKAELQRVLPAANNKNGSSCDGPRVGIYSEPGMQYVAATYAAWMAGAVAVPLAVSHPPQELDYVIRDAGISAVLTSASGHNKLKDVTHAAGAALHVVQQELFEGSDPWLTTSSSSSSSSSSNAEQQDWQEIAGSSTSDASSGALIVYTSGTTGRPKGALHTHGSLAAQVECLTRAWQWQPSDVMLHALPLHHVHGIINGLYCAHYSGAAISFLPKFSPAAVWQQLMEGDVSVLMAVPTMYSYLLSHYESHMSPEEQHAARAAAARLRLTVSGSAAAPVPLLQRWQALSGQRLLERYGMTETGMILSNPYEGERRPGFVGLPLPGVEVKVVQQSSSSNGNGNGSGDAANEPAASNEDSGAEVLRQGELAVRGPMLFREYWGRPQATAEAFDGEGYFLTGDTVSLEGSPPYYRILGRSSVDIIKSGGFKISALDIEGALLHHADVAEAAVLGLPDEALGEVVAALIVPKAASKPAANEAGSDAAKTGDVLLGQLKGLARRELASYCLPRVWRLLDAPLPRNAMGKVNKKQLLKEFFPEQAAAAAAAAGVK